jgi:hypothetical protein
MFDNDEGDGRVLDIDSGDNEIVIQSLLEDFQVQRDALNKMIEEIENLKENIDKLFPKKLDARYTKFFEEKIKTAVSMFNVVLDIRKELLKTTKDEIELRRKVTGKGDLNDMIDVRKIAKSIEKFDTKNNTLRRKTDKIMPKDKEKV